MTKFRVLFSGTVGIDAGSCDTLSWLLRGQWQLDGKCRALSFALACYSHSASVSLGKVLHESQT